MNIPDIRLSVKDKNLVAMCWLAEMILKSLSREYENVPEHKVPMYNYIREQFEGAYQNAKHLNDMFNEEIRNTFSEEFETTLADLTIAVIALYEAATPEMMLKILRAAGMSEAMSVDVYARGLGLEGGKEQK